MEKNCNNYTQNQYSFLLEIKEIIEKSRNSNTMLHPEQEIYKLIQKRIEKSLEEGHKKHLSLQIPNTIIPSELDVMYKAFDWIFEKEPSFSNGWA